MPQVMPLSRLGDVRICDFPNALNVCKSERGHSCLPPRIGQAPPPAHKNVRAPEESQMRTS